MHALERTVTSTNWITLLMVFLLICIVVLKKIDANRLKEIILSPLNSNYIEHETEETSSFFDAFKSVLFIFLTASISFLIYKLTTYYVTESKEGFFTFFKIFSVVFSFFILKRNLEQLLTFTFKIEKELHFFVTSKFSYLNAIAFLLLISLIIVEFSGISSSFLFYFSAILFLFRFVLIISINKNLIFSKLFYFILYLCAFEIAPLFILFKLMF